MKAGIKKARGKFIVNFDEYRMDCLIKDRIRNSQIKGIL